jgi:hypothetical protein
MPCVSSRQGRPAANRIEQTMANYLSTMAADSRDREEAARATSLEKSSSDRQHGQRLALSSPPSASASPRPRTPDLGIRHKRGNWPPVHWCTTGYTRSRLRHKRLVPLREPRTPARREMQRLRGIPEHPPGDASGRTPSRPCAMDRNRVDSYSAAVALHSGQQLLR